MTINWQKLKVIAFMVVFIIRNVFDYIIRCFVSKLGGIFLLVMSLYFILPIYGVIKPYTLEQLFNWFDTLSSEYKVAILPALLTVIGFLVAFHIATTSWRAKLQAHLKMDLVKEIDALYTEASNLAIKADIFSKYIIETTNKIQEGAQNSELQFRVTYAVKLTAEFIVTREKISEIMSKLYQLVGNRASVLMNIWWAEKKLNEANRVFKMVVDASWISLPYIDEAQPDIIESFASQINIDEYRHLASVSNDANIYIANLTGWVKGQILSQIFEPNMSQLYAIISNAYNISKGIFEVGARGKRLKDDGEIK